ncbi:hypothetical protein [Methylobacterium frigidaeris]|nr:hypothetical protein [Methylobacterium frigidaeris]PIK74807.1 hypothetical protein CS379_00475 [Methylobacterium frigidaeris]
MVSVPFASAAAVTNAMAALSAADRPACVAHPQADGTYLVTAPDRLEAALRAPHPVAPLALPDVSSAQAKIQLARAGLLPAVKSAVAAAGTEVEIWFSDARTWQRGNPYVAALGAALGLSAGEIDDLFRQAAAIAA